MNEPYPLHLCVFVLTYLYRFLLRDVTSMPLTLTSRLRIPKCVSASIRCPGWILGCTFRSRCKNEDPYLGLHSCLSLYLQQPVPVIVNSSSQSQDFTRLHCGYLIGKNTYLSHSFSWSTEPKPPPSLRKSGRRGISAPSSRRRT